MARPIFYLDIETDNSEGYGLDPYLTKVVTIQILLPNGQVFIDKDPENVDKLKRVFNEGLIVGANIKFDAKVLEAQFHVQLKHLWDVQLAEHVISGGNKARQKGAVTYKALVKQYCGVDISKEEQTTFKLGVPLTKAQKDYICKDVEYLPCIYEAQLEKLKSLDLMDTANIEMECIPSMIWLELSGINLDAGQVSDLTAKFYELREKAREEIYKSLNSAINFNSSKQVVTAFRNLGIPVENAQKDHLKQFMGKYPIIRAYLEFKAMEKIYRDFAKKVPQSRHKLTGRVHADFRQFGARSGRMSCAKPNLQQQPAKNIEIITEDGQKKELNWRSVYRAPPGYKLITADYNQMELRLLTEASQDPIMIKAFNEGLDLHTMTAEAIYKTHIDKETKEGKKKRTAAKKVNFGIPYGVSKWGLFRQLQAELIECDVEDAAAMLIAHSRAYPVLHQYLRRKEHEAKANLQVRNLAGRLICYTNPNQTVLREIERRKKIEQGLIKSTKKLMPLDAYKAMLRRSIGNNGKNNPIQSLGADILKIALADIYNKLNSGPVDFTQKQVRLVNVVHDEIVLEVPEEQVKYAAQVVKEAMESAGKRYIKSIDCPADPEIADYWKK